MPAKHTIVRVADSINDGPVETPAVTERITQLKANTLHCLKYIIRNTDCPKYITDC